MRGRRRFPRSLLSDQGVSGSGILRFLDRVEAQRIELHSLMVVRHGQVVAEGWWSPYDRETSHRLYSLSKSFTSTAVGLLSQEERLQVDAPVLSFFPEHNTRGFPFPGEAGRGSSGRRPFGLPGSFFRPLGFDVAFHRF